MSIFDRFWGTPKKPEAPAAPAPQTAPADLGSATTDRRNRKRKNARHGATALIIDDSATVVAALRKILRSAGYVTLEAMDAERGLEITAREKPDLIFLDIILPGMNGFGALRAIRKDPATQHIPVIMISGNEHATEQFYADRIGADDFMKKPFSRFEVFARIENLLDANRVPRRKGDTSHDPVSHRPAPSSDSIAAATPGTALGAVRWSALDARKELTAMGLQYFDSLQFFAAIRRGDLLAVELFLASGGVAVHEPVNGQTALGLATDIGRMDMVRLMRAPAPMPATGTAAA
jgi:twitching motility two-component system response regulator PilH